MADPMTHSITREEALALAHLSMETVHLTSMSEAVLGRLTRLGLIDLDEQAFVHVRRDAALRALAGFVRGGAS